MVEMITADMLRFASRKLGRCYELSAARFFSRVSSGCGSTIGPGILVVKMNPLKRKPTKPLPSAMTKKKSPSGRDKEPKQLAEPKSLISKKR
jgi:hypothetical protein